MAFLASSQLLLELFSFSCQGRGFSTRVRENHPLLLAHQMSSKLAVGEIGLSEGLYEELLDSNQGQELHVR